MATKYRLAEQVRTQLNGGRTGTNSNLAQQDCLLAVTQAYATVVAENWFLGQTEGNRGIDGAYLYPFENIEIKCSDSRKMLYCDIPASYVGSIPHQLGFNSFCLMGNEKDQFVVVGAGDVTLMRGLDIEMMEGNTTFFIENKKAWLPNMPLSNAGLFAFMRLAVALDGISDDEEVSIPPDVEAKIIERAKISLAPQKQLPHDNNVNVTK